MELKDIRLKMDAFVRHKGWYAENSVKPQTPKNLAVSLALEAAELLECFQWGESGDPAAAADELADIVLYAAQISNVLQIDLDEAVEKKLARNMERVWPPVSKG